MTFFTSDLHMGHENIIRFCSRPFSSLKEMDEALVRNWNSRIGVDDDVYVLGDLFYRMKADPPAVLDRLSGRKHLIVGNHDHTWISRVPLERHFVSVDDLLVLKEEGRIMVLCHYPLLSWPHKEHGSWCIFGHIHNSCTSGPEWDLIRSSPYMLNAGVDVNAFVPVSFDELVRNNETFKRTGAV